jgi:hypothetical protein
MRPSVLASICTSLAAAAVLGGDVPPDPARVVSAEIEAKLARQPAVYLVLDPPRRTIEVRARGIVLDAIPLQGVETVSQQPLFGGSTPTVPAVPGLWTVAEGPGDTDREVIAPATLRPYSNDDEAEPAVAPAAKATRGPAPTPTPVPEAPSSYRARMDNGWDLWVTDRLPPSTPLAHFWAAVGDGWERLRGTSRSFRPAIMLAVSVQDARRLHHLMRKGMAIVVADGAP